MPRELLYGCIHHELKHVLPVAGNRLLFAFVRHPLDWWRSYWCYRIMTGWVDHEIDRTCQSNDFQAFMWRVVEQLPGWCSSMYWRFVGPPHRPIHFIGQFERLADDLANALRLAGEDFDERVIYSTPAQNRGDYSKWPAQYSASLRTAVMRAEREAIDRFGY